MCIKSHRFLCHPYRSWEFHDGIKYQCPGVAVPKCRRFWRALIWTSPTRKYRSLSKLCKYSTLVVVTFVHPHHYHHCSGSRCPMLPTICRPDKQHKSAALISKSSGLSSMKSKRKKFWRSGGVNRAHQFYHTGDGRNPKQPPGMYKTL